MSNSEINKSMIKLQKFTNLSDMIESFPSLVDILCGKELFIQLRAHICAKCY